MRERSTRISVFAWLILALGLHACAPKEAPKQKVPVAAHESLSTIPSTEELKQRIEIPVDRLETIKVGSQAIAQIRSAVADFPRGTTSGTRGELVSCGTSVCVCTGDRDCNELFTTICRTPTIPAYCSGSGDSTFCICKIRER
jgi:hypothetical protein